MCDIMSLSMVSETQALVCTVHWSKKNCVGSVVALQPSCIRGCASCDHHGRVQHDLLYTYNRKT